MKTVQSNCKLILVLSFLLLQLTSSFQIQSQQSGANLLMSSSSNHQYQAMVDDQMNVRILKLEKSRFEVQASIKISCKPASISIQSGENSQIKPENDPTYHISVICQNDDMLNYLYNPLDKKLKEIQKQKKEGLENSRGSARLLQNSTSTCGNSIIETGETCDDGNKVAGDGCSVTCTLECGNGILNTNLQQCDDGNNADGDGCSSTCKKEDASLALPLALGISLGAVALIGIIIGKIALTKSSITAGAVSGLNAGQRPLEIQQSTKVMNPSGNLY